MRARHLLLLIAVWTLACSDSARPEKLRLRDEPSGAGTQTDDGAAAERSDAGSTDNALSVQVEDRAGLEIRIVTLQCAGDCAEVKAVASGGNPPYAFAWSDGSTQSERLLCADTTSHFEVSATDSAIADDEFEYAAQSAVATVTAEVFDCNAADAGVADAGVTDASTEEVPHTTICIDTSGERQTQAAWSICKASPQFEATGMSTETCEELGYGVHHVRVGGYNDGSAETEEESLTGWLCQPLRANETTYLNVTLSGVLVGDDPLGLNAQVQVELWGGSAPCDARELLWTSDAVAVDSFGSQCARVTPQQDHTHLRAFIHVMGAGFDRRFACYSLEFQGSGLECNP